jgi:hypothetical protein
MVTTLGPPKRPREPVARRIFRHPGTGHEVTLVVERELTGDGEEPGWWVDLEDTPGGPAWLARLRYATLCWTRTQARRAFAERQRALRAAGYMRADLGRERPGRGSP